MTEDSSSHRPTKRIHVYSETSRRADLEFVCIFGHDGEGEATGNTHAPNLSKRMSFGRLPLIVTDGFEFYQKVIRRFFGPAVVFYIESRRFLIRDSPRATTYEQKTGGADGVKGA